MVLVNKLLFISKTMGKQRIACVDKTAFLWEKQTAETKTWLGKCYL